LNIETFEQKNTTFIELDQAQAEKILHFWGFTEKDYFYAKEKMLYIIYDVDSNQICTISFDDIPITRNEIKTKYKKVDFNTLPNMQKRRLWVNEKDIKDFYTGIYQPTSDYILYEEI